MHAIDATSYRPAAAGFVGPLLPAVVIAPDAPNPTAHPGAHLGPPAPARML